MTMDNGMDCEPSWAELKQLLENTTANRDAWEATAAEIEAERDEQSAWADDAREAAIHWKIQHDAAVEREQVLAAHVAQLRQALTAHAMHSVFASSEERTAHAQKALAEITPINLVCRQVDSTSNPDD